MSLAGGFMCFYVHPDPWGIWSNLTKISQMGWNHQLEIALICFWQDAFENLAAMEWKMEMLEQSMFCK